MGRDTAYGRLCDAGSVARRCSRRRPRQKIAGNPCEGIKHLYNNDRSEIIWTDSDVDRIKKTYSREIADAIDLARHTGLRLGDLVRLSWSHIGEYAIIITTGKSKHRREAIIPLYDALRAVLARIPKRATTILTSSKKRLDGRWFRQFIQQSEDRCWHV